MAGEPQRQSVEIRRRLVSNARLRSVVIMRGSNPIEDQMIGFDRQSPFEALVFLLAAATLAVATTSAGAAPGDDDTFPSGQRIFQDHCGACHGTEERGTAQWPRY